VALSLAGCLYGFAGGGLPNIKTVAILPFDNETPEPALTTEVATAVHQAIENRLGLRPSGEQSADAVVRGRITRYDSGLPLTYQSATGQPPNVTRRQVQITVDIAIVDQRDGKTLWQNQSLTVLGDYQPPSEAEGRKVALDKLVTEIVNGAQSQW
jgi:lipopolysaccharide assembly LptE-like protein